jgi:hypothetical protein
VLTLAPATDESLIALSTVPSLLPPSAVGKPVNLSTIFRWVMKGVRGVRLEALRAGGRWYTSESALRRFTSRLTELALPHGTPLPSPSQMRGAADRAGRLLAARGA